VEAILNVEGVTVKVISAKELSEKWELNEDDIFRELLEVLREFKRGEWKPGERGYLVNDERKEVYIIDPDDIYVIGSGSGVLTLSKLCEHFGVDKECMTWLLRKLYRLQKIREDVYRHYMSAT